MADTYETLRNSQPARQPGGAGAPPHIEKVVKGLERQVDQAAQDRQERDQNEARLRDRYDREKRS